MRYDFIDIGCSIFDTSIDKYGMKANGILVEPVKEFFDVLPSSNTVKKECAAIAEFNGESQFYAILLEGAELRYWTEDELTRDVENGFIIQDEECSPLVRPAHMGASAFHDPTKFDFAAHLKPTKKIVKTMRLSNLFDAYNVTEIDTFKVDAEGYDIIIVCQLINIMKSKNIKINKIIFEMPHEENDENSSQLKIYNYYLSILKEKFNYEYKKISPNDWSQDVLLTLK
jgi:hypothetical protein